MSVYDHCPVGKPHYIKESTVLRHTGLLDNCLNRWSWKQRFANLQSFLTCVIQQFTSLNHIFITMTVALHIIVRLAKFMLKQTECGTLSRNKTRWWRRLLTSKQIIIMFYEERNALKTFVILQRYTQYVLERNTKCQCNYCLKENPLQVHVGLTVGRFIIHFKYNNILVYTENNTTDYTISL